MRKYPVPIPLHVGRDIRSDFLNTHDYVLFKKPGDHEGVLLHPEVDMLFITRRTLDVVRPAEFVNAARGSQILDKIRSIAIWVGIWVGSPSSFLPSIGFLTYSVNRP